MSKSRAFPTSDLERAVPIDRAVTLRNAEKLLRQGKLDLAIAEYLRLVSDQPRDWASANVLGDLYLRGGQVDKAVDQFARVAESLHREGFLQKAAALYKKILKIRPEHEHALLQSAEIAAGQGLLADARSYLNVVLQRRRARGDERGVTEIRIRLGSLDPADFEARLDAARARRQIGDAAGALAELKAVATELATKGLRAAAIEVLREAAAFSPADAELGECLFDLYLASGDLTRARGCVATARQWKMLAAALEADGHADQALEAMGEAARLDPADADLRLRVAQALQLRNSAPAPADDLIVESVGDDTQLLPEAAEVTPTAAAPPDGRARPPAPGTDPEERQDTDRFELTSEEIDLASVLGNLEGLPRSGQASAPSKVDVASGVPIEADDLEGVFARLRDEASRQSPTDAESFYGNGLALRDAGRIDEAVQALEQASRSPRLRFQAASLLGRIYRERKATLQAIEWFERAAQVPAPSADEGHRLLYDLADALESAGETARALAICLELKADAGDYRDVSERVERLARVQTRG